MTNTTNHKLDHAWDLVVTRVTRPIGDAGCRVSGTIDAYRFEALLSPDATQSPEYLGGDSRITNLWVQRVADRAAVYQWAWRLRQPPADPTVEAVVDYLTAHLADYVWPAGAGTT